MATKTEIILREKEIQGLSFSLNSKLFISSLLTIITFFIANSLSEILWVAGMMLTLTVILYILLRMLRRNKFVSIIGIVCVLIDILIISALPFVWYNSVGGESVPRTYLVKTYSHYIIFGTFVMNAFTIQPLYPLIYAFGVVISQASILLFAQADPRFQSTESFQDAILGSAAHVNSYIMGMGIIGVLGFFLAYLTFRVRRILYSAVANEVKSTQLSRYFSPNVIEEISNAEESFFTAGGREQNVAVLFCDIEGFTELAESLGARKTMATLSSYHAFMLDDIFSYGGTLDKFIGGGMLVTFGTPVPSPEDAKNSILAGLAMKDSLAKWNVQRDLNQEKAIKIRIGIHYGSVMVGNVGIASRLEYTVIGDTVNVASRMEALGKDVHKSFLISRELLSEVKDTSIFTAKFKSIGNHSFRGKSKNTEIISVEQ